MSLHRLTEITLGVPNVAETAEYYTQFGLIPQQPRSADPAGREFATVDGGQQLRLVKTPIRKLLSLGIGVDDQDDLGRIGASLQRLGVMSRTENNQLRTKEPITRLDVIVSITPRIKAKPVSIAAYNSPGNIARPNVRAPSLLRSEPVRPRRLGHLGLGSTDAPVSRRFFTEGIGFKISDEVKDSATFMRCSSDHHNLVVMSAPVNFLHHSAWEVEDMDEIGRGARAVLEGHPERHTWGLGRHWLGSNFFYYLRDPAGNLNEYYSDLDEIIDDELWKPGVFDAAAAATLWGPPAPPSLIHPDDLAELMAAQH